MVQSNKAIVDSLGAFMKRAVTITLCAILFLIITLSVVVYPTISVKSIKLGSSKVYLGVGQTYNLEVIFTPASTIQKSLTYVTANKKIAEISTAGKITGSSEGTTTITVYTVNKKIFAKCDVTVLKSGVNKGFLPYTGKTVTFDVFAADSFIKEDVNSAAYQIYRKTVGNIDINWELAPFSDFYNKERVFCSSGTIPDIMWIKAPDIMSDFSTSGLFLDLNKYKDYTPNWTAACKKIPALKSLTNQKGEQFDMECVINDYPMETFYANKTLLDKLGIAIPNTLAEFEAALKKVKEADPTITPFHTQWGYSYYMDCFGLSLGTRRGMYFNPEDNRWKFALTSPESKYKELISLMADYYKKGYFNPEYSTMADDQVAQLIASNKWAFTFTYCNQIQGWYNVDRKGKFPIDIVPMLPFAADGVKPSTRCAYVSDSPLWAYVASAKVKNPELAVAWMDAQLGEEISTAFQWGQEGISYTVDANGKKHWIQAFLDKGDQAAKELGIWNILAPRYICYRDDSSVLQKFNPVVQKAESQLVAAIKSGAVDCPYYRSEPKFTDAEKDELSEIMTPISTKLSEGEAQFVLGIRPMSEWSEFVTEVKAVADLDRAIEIYNKAKQSPDRMQARDRTYITP